MLSLNQTVSSPRSILGCSYIKSITKTFSMFVRTRSVLKSSFTSAVVGPSTFVAGTLPFELANSLSYVDDIIPVLIIRC